MKKLALFIVIFLIFSTLTPAMEAKEAKNEVQSLFDFNPQYESLSFSVEGSIRMHVFLLNPTFIFSGRGGRDDNFEAMAPEVEVTEAYFRVLVVPLSIGSATDIAEEIIGTVVGVSEPTEEVLRGYQTVLNDDDLYFIWERIIEEKSDRETVELIEEGKVSELAVKRGFSQGRIYGGKMTFEDGLAERVVAYSDEWWVDLSVYWKSIGDYNFIKEVSGNGFYERPVTVEISFSDYELKY